jgi:hypothetical protein
MSAFGKADPLHDYLAKRLLPAVQLLVLFAPCPHAANIAERTVMTQATSPQLVPRVSALARPMPG